MAEANSHCSVVGFLGMLIQVILGVLSFSVLIIKRHYEQPKRPWRVWRYDTFKQAFSQLLAHFINVTISMALTEEQPDSDTCLWYFTTNVVDNTIGVFICVMILRKLEKKFIRDKLFHLISGNYYEISEDNELEGENRETQQEVELSNQKIEINYRAWMTQLVIWNLIVMLSKAILFLIQFIFRVILEKVSQLLLGWIEKYPNFQLIFVIIVVPVIMNGLAFWVQDNFLKKRDITAQLKQLEKKDQSGEMKQVDNIEKIDHKLSYSPQHNQQQNDSQNKFHEKKMEMYKNDSDVCQQHKS